MKSRKLCEIPQQPDVLGETGRRLEGEGRRLGCLYLSLSCKVHIQGGSLVREGTPPSPGPHSACTGTDA